MVDYYDDFVNFLEEECRIDVFKIPDIYSLMDDCMNELTEYFDKYKGCDTVARDELRDAFSRSLIGMDWGFGHEEFDQRIEFYLMDEQ